MEFAEDTRKRQPARFIALAGGAVTLLVFYFGLLLKEQADLASVAQHNRDYVESSEKQFNSLQSQINNRFSTQDTRYHELEEKLEDTQGKISEIEKRSSIDAVEMSSLKEILIAFKEQSNQGRAERMAADDLLAKHLDEMSLRVTEIQRQTSTIEGKLDSMSPFMLNPSRGKGQ